MANDEPRPRWLGLNLLLAFVPATLALRYALHRDDALTFFAAGLAIVPLAGLIGQATEELAKEVGPRLGGLLNATFGNATELIIAVFAILAGRLDLVKASISGSIIGNLLLVLGVGIVVGGWRRTTLAFNRTVAGVHASMLTLAVIGLYVPATFYHAKPNPDPLAVEALSLAVAAVLMLVYVAGLVFTFVTHQSVVRSHVGEAEVARWGRRAALLILLAATGLVAWMSEILVGTVEPTVRALGLSEFFLGVIVIPIVGNAAEHGAATILAARGKMDLALDIAIGSSTQIALFVAPLLVFVSLLVGRPMDYVFTRDELLAVGLAVTITALISLDGETHWLEGAQLVGAYLIMALAFLFLG